MSDTFAKGVRLHQLLQTLLKDYPLKVFLNAGVSRIALGRASGSIDMEATDTPETTPLAEGAHG